MSVAVGLGLAGFPFSGAAVYWRWVDLCETGGADSLWQTDRLVSREPILECMAVMAALAGRTRRIKFGMNILSMAMRDPVLVAKQCATIDLLTDGRLLPAFGVGSPLGPEWTALHLDTRTRGRRTDEGLEIVRRLWREDNVDFRGVHYRLSDVSISPKPRRGTCRCDRRRVPGRDPPHGAHRHRLARGTRDAGRGRARGRAIRAAAAEAGRAIDVDRCGAGFACYFGSPTDPAVGPATEGCQAHGPRSPRPFRRRRCGGDRRTDRRVRGHQRLKVPARPVAFEDAAVFGQTRHVPAGVLPLTFSRCPNR